ncbi:MAG: hypothetical protein Q8M15_15000 [Bacteroidota bacterium]|nr:hypothetical protein [Bacteroidota bacterium]
MNPQLEEIREKRQHKVAGIFKYFSTVMGVFYIVMGFIFFFFPFLENIDIFTKTFISIMLVAYGSFRLYRVFKS